LLFAAAALFFAVAADLTAAACAVASWLIRPFSSICS